MSVQTQAMFDKLRKMATEDKKNQPADMLFAEIGITLLEATFNNLDRIATALEQKYRQPGDFT